MADRTEDQLVLLEQAVESLGQSPTGYEYALALVDQGGALRRAGRPQEAGEPLYMGLELAMECGADGLARRARSELAAAGLGAFRRRPVSAEPLTELEREVAGMASSGMPAAQIADRLGVEVRDAVQLLAAAHRKVGAGPSGLSRALGRLAEIAEEDDEVEEAEDSDGNSGRGGVSGLGRAAGDGPGGRGGLGGLGAAGAGGGGLVIPQREAPDEDAEAWQRSSG